MSKSLYTEIIIDAPREKVWEILMDFEEYGNWNPFITQISGSTKVGGKLSVKLQQPEGKAFTFKPRVVVCEKAEEFKWQGHMIVPGIFDGEHCFKLKPVEGNKTKLIQRENFKGILLKYLWKDLNTKTVRGFELMNSALKERAEASI